MPTCSSAGSISAGPRGVGSRFSTGVATVRPTVARGSISRELLDARSKEPLGTGLGVLDVEHPGGGVVITHFVGTRDKRFVI